MNREELITTDLVGTFGLTDERCRIAAPRRMFVEADRQGFAALITRLRDEHQFTWLCTITGLDAGDTYEVIYHLAAPDGIVLSLKLPVPKDNPTIESMIPTYNGAVYYERELVDLLGITVEGLPKGNRYPLPDDWPAGQYPLRKDWTPPQPATPGPGTAENVGPKAGDAGQAKSPGQEGR
jgi:membrane-bound hydrogenase subunit beta